MCFLHVKCLNRHLDNTGPIWFCVSFDLIQKVLLPLALNWTTDFVNAVFITSILWMTSVMGIVFRGHRDNLVNIVGAISSAGNALAVTCTLLNVMQSQDSLPGWATSASIMFIMVSATGSSAVGALAQPCTQALGSLTGLCSTCAVFLLGPARTAARMLGKTGARIFGTAAKKSSKALYVQADQIAQAKARNKSQKDLLRAQCRESRFQTCIKRRLTVM